MTFSSTIVFVFLIQISNYKMGHNKESSSHRCKCKSTTHLHDMDFLPLRILLLFLYSNTYQKKKKPTYSYFSPFLQKENIGSVPFCIFFLLTIFFRHLFTSYINSSFSLLLTTQYFFHMQVYKLLRGLPGEHV